MPLQLKLFTYGVVAIAKRSHKKEAGIRSTWSLDKTAPHIKLRIKVH